MDHHSGWQTREVREALLTALRAWTEAGCDCCSPTPLDDALEDMEEHGEALRRFGIEIAFAGQSLADQAAEVVASGQEDGDG